MANPINAISPVISPVGIAPARPSVSGAGSGEFQNLLSSAIGNVETTRADANQRVSRFLAGEGEELHTVVLATQRAELSLELFQQVRNKVVQAYQEVMRMQM